VGIPELVERINEHRAAIASAGVLEERRRRNLRAEVLGLATVRLRRRLEDAADADPATAALLDEVAARRLDPASAAARLLEELG
jgi:LAO/AO transport system kinase